MHSVGSQEDAGPRAGPLWETTKKTAVKLMPRTVIALLLHSTYSTTLVIM